LRGKDPAAHAEEHAGAGPGHALKKAAAVEGIVRAIGGDEVGHVGDEVWFCSFLRDAGASHGMETKEVLSKFPAFRKISLGE
jgi:hypothetical protein